MRRANIVLFHCNCDQLIAAIGNIIFKTLYAPPPLRCGSCRQFNGCNCIHPNYFLLISNLELANIVSMSLADFNKLESCILTALDFNVSGAEINTNVEQISTECADLMCVESIMDL